MSRCRMRCCRSAPLRCKRWGDGSLEHRKTRSFRYGGVFQAQGGFVELLTLEDRQWNALVQLLGRPPWTQDAALSDPLERSRRGDEINRHIRAWMRRHNSRGHRALGARAGCAGREIPVSRRGDRRRARTLGAACSRRSPWMRASRRKFWGRRFSFCARRSKGVAECRRSVRNFQSPRHEPHQRALWPAYA